MTVQLGGSNSWLDSLSQSSWKDDVDFSSGDSSWTDNFKDTSLGDNSFDTSWIDNSLSDDSWYTDSSDTDTSFLSDIWDWVKSPEGTNTLGGALDSILDLWNTDQKNNNKSNRSSGGSGGGSEGPSAAELQDARYAMHNRSINTPTNMSVRKFK